MLKFEEVSVSSMRDAIRGMRNSFDSWEKSDSYGYSHFNLGENDLKLAKKLVVAGSSHRKFLRQIFVSVDITAPLYW